jgi:hypothetical protein
MACDDLNKEIANRLPGWRLEAAKAKRLASLYAQAPHPADAARGDTVTPAGRAAIALAGRLERLVAGAEEGYLYFAADDLEFQMAPKNKELIDEAQRLGRVVNQWPLTDADGKELLAEARARYKPSMSEGA